MSKLHAVYVPDPVVNLMIVSDPLVVTVGEPVTVPVYLDVGTEIITTPLPPAPPVNN